MMFDSFAISTSFFFGGDVVSTFNTFISWGDVVSNTGDYLLAHL
jgi:hypothetical protein